MEVALLTVIAVALAMLVAARVASRLPSPAGALQPEKKGGAGATPRAPSLLDWLLGNNHAIMAVLVSLAVLGCSLFIILKGSYEGESSKWAFGAIGTIIGYWLRPPRDAFKA
jgi:hypothetical protein